jgi:glycosyltransferase involved in cell wall biosynthesis
VGRHRQVDVCILLENMHTADVTVASRTVFIPNPEWLLDESRWKLPLVDRIACKTRHAEQVLREHGLDATFVGFTSQDRFDGTVSPDRRRFLNIASGGTHKGTREVLELWSAHPEWPQLTILAGRSKLDADERHNITIIRDWVTEQELVRYMRSSGVHLCCSTSEGFGHSIVEAMSCGVLVITTDAPPMNEFINEARGVLVATSGMRPMRWGVHAELDLGSLERAIETAIRMDDGEFEARCASARAWYDENRSGFIDRIGGMLTGLLQPPASRR